MAKRHNHDANMGDWGHELLNLCHDNVLFIFNGRTLGDESGEFTSLANEERNIVDYIVGSHVVWQAATHVEVVIDDTRYCAMGGDSDHRLLCLRLNIDYIFVEPQHTIVTTSSLDSNMINQKLKNINFPNSEFWKPMGY
jgi:hypothetical protein